MRLHELILNSSILKSYFKLVIFFIIPTCLTSSFKEQQAWGTDISLNREILSNFEINTDISETATQLRLTRMQVTYKIRKEKPELGEPAEKSATVAFRIRNNKEATSLLHSICRQFGGRIAQAQEGWAETDETSPPSFVLSLVGYDVTHTREEHKPIFEWINVNDSYRITNMLCQK